MVVCLENNGYAYSTPTSRQTAARSLAEKAAAFGCASDTGDGNDVLAAYNAAKRAGGRRRDAARSRDVPDEGPCRARQPVVRAAGNDRGVEGEGPGRALRARADPARHRHGE